MKWGGYRAPEVQERGEKIQRPPSLISPSAHGEGQWRQFWQPQERRFFFFFFLESIRLISLRLCGAPVPSPLKVRYTHGKTGYINVQPAKPRRCPKKYPLPPPHPLPVRPRINVCFLRHAPTSPSPYKYEFLRHHAPTGPPFTESFAKQEINADRS